MSRGACSPSPVLVAHRLVELLFLGNCPARMVLHVPVQELECVGHAVVGVRQFRQAFPLILLQRTL